MEPNIHAIRRARLVSLLRDPTAEMRQKLAEIEADGARLRSRPDFVWHSLLVSLSTHGNSRGHVGLIDNQTNYSRVTYETVAALPPTKRTEWLSEVFRAAKVRMPDIKAHRLSRNYEIVQSLGGSPAATAHAMALTGREAKIAFLKQFHGIGDKYSRVIWMDACDPDFDDCIGLDQRVMKVSELLGFRDKKYPVEEHRFQQLAAEAGCRACDVDRILYWFKDYVISRLEAV